VHELAEKIARAASYDDRPGPSLELYYRTEPHLLSEERWTLRFYTVRVTKAGRVTRTGHRVTRTGHRVTGPSFDAVVRAASMVVDQHAEEITAAHRVAAAAF
jgi:hypothetical protein